MEAPERARQLAVLAEGVGEPPEPGERGRGRQEQEEGARDADVEAQRDVQPVRQVRVQRGDDPHQRRTRPLRPELGRAVARGKRHQADERDRDVHGDNGADAAEEALRQLHSRPPRLLGEIRDGLQPGIGEHRERKGEHDLVPRRRAAERDALRQGLRRPEERKPQHDEQELGDEVERRDARARRVNPSPAGQARGADGEDDADADDRVPRPRVEGGDPDRVAEVMRQEERRESGHDQVVEEQRPAGDEAGQVVERSPDERRRAARLAQLGRALGVRQRHDEEEQPRREQHVRREPERPPGDDPEREVDRARDLAVRDAEEVVCAQPSLELRQLTRHTASCEVLRTSHEVDRTGALRARALWRWSGVYRFGAPSCRRGQAAPRSRRVCHGPCRRR